MSNDKVENMVHKAYYSPLTSLNTYVLDNVCVKNRSGNTDLSALDINYKVVNYEGIGIQNGEKLDVYCNKRRREMIESYLLDKDKSESKEYKAYAKGLIEIHENNVDIEELVNKSYSDILRLMNYYTVDSKCIKNRYGNIDEMSKERADIYMKDFGNIGIQIDNKLDVYCDVQTKDRIIDRINSTNSNRLVSAYDNKLINIYTS